MKKLKAIQLLLTLAALALWAPGCATGNVNPPQSRANTGYVDFYAESSGEIIWEVARFDAHAQDFQRVFSEFKPIEGRVLRLAFPPGCYRLRLTFLNRVVREATEVAVAVQDGRIIPVSITLTEVGTVLVETKEYNRGGTAKGRYGRRTKFGSDESTMYSLSAVPDAPMPYQVKERMSYAR